MRYNEKIEKLETPTMEWNKRTPKEILQYAVGALLYMPATNVKIADEIKSHRYPSLKSMVLCLEDSIGDAMVEEAEEAVETILKKLLNCYKEGEISISELPLIFIRVREIGQMTRLYEKCGEAIKMITGFVWPKINKSNINGYIKEFEEISKKVNEPLYVMPIIESKEVMYKQTRIENLLYLNTALKRISTKVLGIRVGGADFCSIFGVRRGMNRTIWDIQVVADCLADIINIFSRNYVVSGPVWEFFGKDSNAAWAEGLRRELETDNLNGIIGKTAIHPTQLEVIQESLIVSYSDYKDAMNILGTSADLIGVQKSYEGNKMNEVKTHSNWAKKIVCLSNIYGVRKEQ